MDVQVVGVATASLPRAWQSEALKWVSMGMGVQAITDRLGLTVLEWAELLDTVPAYAARFHRARKLALESRSDELITVPDTIVDDTTAKRAQLYSKNVSWLLERRIPDQYGQRQYLDVAVQVDIRAAIEEGRKRVDPSGLADWLIG